MLFILSQLQLLLVLSANFSCHPRSAAILAPCWQRVSRAGDSTHRTLPYGCCSSWGYGVLTCRCASASHTHTCTHIPTHTHTPLVITRHNFYGAAQLRWLRHDVYVSLVPPIPLSLSLSLYLPLSPHYRVSFWSVIFFIFNYCFRGLLRPFVAAATARRGRADKL